MKRLFRYQKMEAWVLSRNVSANSATSLSASMRLSLLNFPHVQQLLPSGTAFVPQHCLASDTYIHTYSRIINWWEFWWDLNEYSHVSSMSSHVYLLNIVAYFLSLSKSQRLWWYLFFIYIILQKNCLSNTIIIIDLHNGHFN